MSRRRPAAAFVLAILLTMNPPPESAVGAWSASADAVSALHVDGNQLVDSSGLTVQVRGVNRSGTEYACIQGWGIFSGPNDAASIQAMKAWRVNAVRVPLNEDCWLGINGVPTAYSGPAYQQAIKDYVSLLNQNGLYAILDLHWSAPGTSAANWYAPMPDLDHSPDLWSGVAAAFKGNDAVIFELFNEPWPDSQQDSTAAWTCWRDGGSCPGVSFAAAGMQTLVNAVRAAGATNVLVLDGVSYGNSLSQWLTYKPNDLMLRRDRRCGGCAGPCACDRDRHELRLCVHDDDHELARRATGRLRRLDLERLGFRLLVDRAHQRLCRDADRLRSDVQTASG